MTITVTTATTPTAAATTTAATAAAATTATTTPVAATVGARVQRAELHHVAVSGRTDWLLLRITDSDGVSGWGECSDAGPLTAVLRELRELAAWGQQAPDVGEFTRRTIAGAIEQAELDQAARRAGRPLRDVLAEAGASLGGAGAPAGAVPADSVELYADLNRAPGGRAPAEVAATALAAVRAGFRTVKLAPFDTPGGDRLGYLGLARVQAVREAVGDDVTILVDCHERLSLEDLTPLLEPFAELGIGWLEDGVGIDRPADLARLRGLTGLTLAGGGLAHRIEQVEAAAGLLDVLLPDVKHAGGPLAALALARATDARISPRNSSGPVATLHSAHLAAAIGAGPLAYAFGEVPWRAAVTGGREQIRDGRLILPAGPGLGGEPDLRHPEVVKVWSDVIDLRRTSC